MAYNCIDGCTATYNKRGGLTSHQLTCAIYDLHVVNKQANHRRIDQQQPEPDSSARKKPRFFTDPLAPLSRKLPQLFSRQNHPVLPEHEQCRTASPDIMADLAAGDSNISLAPSPLDSESDLPPGLMDVDSDLPTTFRSDPPSSSAAARAHRVTLRIPALRQDIMPTAPPAVVYSSGSDSGQSDDPTVDETQPVLVRTRIKKLTLIVRDKVNVVTNSFHLFRLYLHRPSYDPDHEVPVEMLSNIGQPLLQPEVASAPSVAPRKAFSVAGIMEWMNNGNDKKSNAEVNQLVHGVLRHPQFSVDELDGFNALRENNNLDRAEEDLKETPFSDGFRETSLKIEVSNGDQVTPKTSCFTIPGFHSRKICSVIKAAFAEPLAKSFHMSPFKLFQKLPGEAEKRVFSELYNSDLFISEHDKVQRAPTDDINCGLEKAVAALMFWSDSTHLANFGTASMWPVYLFFGNLSQYTRSCPTSGACQHIAYIPSLPESLQDSLSKFHRKWGTQHKEVLTHCKRELMHEVWRDLLDDELVHAYHYGMVVDCADGIQRRIYPRIFTYSADYPEKVLLATIRDQGLCPCPRCLIPKPKLDQMGTIPDSKLRLKKTRVFMLALVKSARSLIYKHGNKITGARVEVLLKGTSSVPTMNAFIDRLGPGFDLSKMLVVDFLHEFELGVWKALFTHLIRVLFSESEGGGHLVQELDRRFRQVTTFGVDTIRLFATNTSEMKKLAARDFEDILQCCIPVFDSLLEGVKNTKVMTLLYRVSEFHSLAKLRMHTEDTLDHLAKATRELGKVMRDFRDFSDKNFDTLELPKEVSARNKREAEQASKRLANGESPIEKSKGTKKKGLNLFTYKYHALGDYAPCIRMVGPLGSHSTQLGELAHRIVKALYGLTNKKNATKQIAKRYRRLTRARLSRDSRGIHTRRRAQQAKYGDTDVRIHHHISASKNRASDVGTYLRGHSAEDPALKSFRPKLEDHVLARLLGHQYSADMENTFMQEDRNTVHVRRLFQTQTVRVNYTTYDVRRDQDTVNPQSHADVMVHSPENDPESSPFWYARVLAVYHVDVVSLHPKLSKEVYGEPQTLQVLLVRWFGIVPDQRSGFKAGRLTKVGFVEEEDEYAFSFLDPQQIIRGCHLIPVFAEERTQLLQTNAKTLARNSADVEEWSFYYINIFVDRDMFMRYRGGGPGHGEDGVIQQRRLDISALGNDDGDDRDRDEKAALSVRDEQSDADSDEETGGEDLDESDDQDLVDDYYASD